jgi:hypothetical protein
MSKMSYIMAFSQLELFLKISLSPMLITLQQANPIFEWQQQKMLPSPWQKGKIFGLEHRRKNIF